MYQLEAPRRGVPPWSPSAVRAGQGRDC